jgi:glycosyl transferase, family 25
VISAADLGTYVVNLRRRPDRRRRMTTLLPGELRVRFTSDWSGPFDGLDLDRRIVEAAGYRLFPWKLPSANAWWDRSLRRGEVGCALSHLACWRDAEANHERFAVVLEDDVTLAPDFLERLLAGLRWLTHHGHAFDVLYLGRCPRGRDLPVVPGLVAPGFSYGSFGYLLSGGGLEAILGAHFGQAILPVDEFLPAMYVDHPRPDIRARFPRRVVALAFDPPLVEQLPKRETGSDTRNSDFIDGPQSG